MKLKHIELGGSMQKEVALKEELIGTLKAIKEEFKRFSHEIPEQFIRGYIYAIESERKINLPSHWYEEIIEFVKK